MDKAKALIMQDKAGNIQKVYSTSERFDGGIHWKFVKLLKQIFLKCCIKLSAQMP